MQVNGIFYWDCSGSQVPLYWDISSPTRFNCCCFISMPFIHQSKRMLSTVYSQYIIQIKICAEYRDMLPRPRLVCQEPGLRPIGRSPGVPDKSSIYSIHFPIFFFIPLWVWLGTLQDCQCPLPLSIVIRMRLVIRQSKLPACLAEVQLTHQNTLAFKSQPGENDR